MSDITIEGDVKAQQFVLISFNSTKPTWKDSRLNIGPKDLPVKVRRVTYWDTEAYCIPFYMATKINKLLEIY
jgi:maltose phosphorylase